MAKAVISINIQNSGLSVFRQEFNALVKDLKRVDGKRFVYEIEFRQPSAGTMSAFKLMSRATVAEGLKRAHRDTKPQIYSDRIAAGGPFRQRVDAMFDYLQKSGPREVITTRREAQANFTQMDGRIFRRKAGRLGQTISIATRKQIEMQLDRLYSKARF